jgi:hypothetical protein
MSEANGSQARARRLREAVLRIREQVRKARTAMQDDARRSHCGWDSEQSGGVRGRVAMQHLVSGGFLAD